LFRCFIAIVILIFNASCSEDTLSRARSGITLIATFLPDTGTEENSYRVSASIGEGNPLYADYKPLIGCYSTLILAGNNVYRIEDKNASGVYETEDGIMIPPGSAVTLDIICNSEEYTVDSIITETTTVTTVDLPSEHPAGVNMAVNFAGQSHCHRLLYQHEIVEDTCPSAGRKAVEMFGNPFVSSITIKAESITKRGRYYLYLIEFTEPAGTDYSKNLSLMSRLLAGKVTPAGFIAR